MRSKPSTKITLTCNYCGRQFQRYRCRLKDGKRHFCDSKCWAAYKAEHAKRKVHIFQTDIPHRGYGPGWKTLRRKLLREANFTCEECGVFSYCLEVHHKVPLREFNGDWRKANERSNLKVVCDACHGKLDSQIP